MNEVYSSSLNLMMFMIKLYGHVDFEQWLGPLDTRIPQGPMHARQRRQRASLILVKFMAEGYYQM